MFRITLPWLFFFLYFIMIVTIPAALNIGTIPLTIMPIAIVFSIFFLTPTEGLLLVLLLSLVVDAFLEFGIGANAIISFSLWFGAFTAIKWLGKPERATLFVLVATLSFFYRIFLYFAAFVSNGITSNFEWITILWAPIADGLIGVYVIYFLHSALVKFKLTEAVLNITQRLSARKIKGF